MILNLIDRMKLPFRKSKEFLTALYDILGFYPHNIEIYRIAFSHKSLSYSRTPDKKARRKNNSRQQSDYTPRPLNNERLEFLGDAVIETVVSDILFRHFEHKREGFLTSTRSKIVQREALNHLATEMGLDRLIHAAQGMSVCQTNIGGNAFEALMGAIYLDRGYKYCHWFIANRVIGRYIDIDKVAKKEVNFKSKLLEWSQKNRINISYRDTSHKGEGKGFSSVLTIEGIIMGRGDGRSKKESQQEASREALTRMRSDAKAYDSLFRAKEKRTAMEAEESFALPKIDEIEATLKSTSSSAKAKDDDNLPVLEQKKSHQRSTASDEAYDAAYNDDADYEVIDTPATEPQLTAADYEAKGLPMPPEADELEEDDEKEEQRRMHQRKARMAKSGATAAENAKAKPEPTPQAADEKPATPPRNEHNKAKKNEAKAKGQAQPANTAEAQTQKATSASTADDPRMIIVRNIEPVEVPANEKESKPKRRKATAPACNDGSMAEATLKKAEASTPAETEAPSSTPSANSEATEVEPEQPEATNEEVQPIAAVASPILENQETEASAQQASQALEEATAQSEEGDANQTVSSPEAEDANVPTEINILSEKNEDTEELFIIENNGKPIDPNEGIEVYPLESSSQEEDLLEPNRESMPYDDDAFELYEIDNLPDITGNDIATETSEAQVEEASAPHATSSVNEPATRPILRHLSLDDFVLGIEPDGEFMTDEAELAPESTPRTPKSRNRKRKPTVKAEQTAVADKQSTPPANEPSTSRSKSRSNRRQGSKKRATEAMSGEAPSAATAEKAGEAETSGKPQRRNRRPAQPAE